MWIKGYRIDPFTKEKLFSFRNLTIIHGLCKCTCWAGNIESALHIFTTLNGLLLFLNLRFPFGETLRRNKCTKWRNMGKCFHPRKDIKASKRIRALNSRFVRSQIIQKTVCGKLKFVSSFLHHSYTRTIKKIILELF